MKRNNTWKKVIHDMAKVISLVNQKGGVGKQQQV